MPRLATLLNRLQARQIAALETDATEVRQQIVDKVNAPRKRKSSVTVLDNLSIAQAVHLLREHGPLLRCDTASRLGITGMTASWRSRQTAKLGLVERVSRGKYQCFTAVQEADRI